MRVSIVVPTFKRPDLLERSVAALLAQNFSPQNFEIVVADNASDPETRWLIEAVAADAPVSIRYLDAAHKPGPAFARNVAWQTATGEIIAFTDDDTIADVDWLKNGIAAFEKDAELAAVTGKTVVPLPERPTDYELNESGLATGEFVTANCFVRRSVLTAIGGFDARFTAAWREDSDLHFRLLENGCKIRRVETAIVVHPIRPTRFGVSLRQQRKAQFDALLFKKHPALFRRKIGFGARRYYRILLWLIIAVGAIYLENLPLALFAAGCWLLLTAQFCGLRLRRTSGAPLHVFEMIVTSILIPPVAVFWRLYGAVKFKVLFF